VLKSHIAKIERVRGGFNIDMLEFELVHGDIAKDRPQFAFRFQMRGALQMLFIDSYADVRRKKEKRKRKSSSRLLLFFRILKSPKIKRCPDHYSRTLECRLPLRQDLRLRQQYHKVDPWQGYQYRRLRQMLIRSR
jgi:hypothetical protein